MFTVGYEGLSIEQFIDVLHAHNIELLLDVRELPLSRKKGFSKRSLMSALENAGIQYLHERELGAPRQIRHALRATGDWESYRKAFMNVLDEKSQLLEHVAVLASKQRVALMCFEKDYSVCHRSLIAERMVEMGLIGNIHHITHLETTEHQAAALAK